MKDNENSRISIIGEQIIDGDSDRVEVVTSGKYIMKNGHCYIGYKEYDENDPTNVSDNLIKVEADTVTITRRTPYYSQLVLEKGKRHQCIYQTMAGDIMIGVFTNTMESELDEKGGRLEVSYTLDFSAGIISENRFIINVEAVEKSV